MLLPSIIQENFLDQDELKFIEQMVLDKHHIYNDFSTSNDSNQTAIYYVWKFYDKAMEPIKQILEPKFKNITGLKNLVVDHSHIFESIVPYQIHTDFFQNRMFKNMNPAYTIIIPIDETPSNTLVFNESSELKSVAEWGKTTNATYNKNPIDQNIIDKYLSHIQPEILKYLSLKEIFEWRPGAIHFCDRKYFHCSDNFKFNNIDRKRAFIFWTSLK
jgi:hypothetical protein